MWSSFIVLLYVTGQGLTSYIYRWIRGITINLFLFHGPVPSLLTTIVRRSAYPGGRDDHFEVLNQSSGAMGHIGRALVHSNQGFLIYLLNTLADIGYGQQIFDLPLCYGLYNTPGNNVTGKIVYNGKKVMSQVLQQFFAVAQHCTHNPCDGPLDQVHPFF